MTPDEVVARLEQAGATLLALRLGYGPAGYRSGMPEPVRQASESYNWSAAKARAAIPSAADITAMDEALAWVQFIPEDRFVLRRIVNARALVSPSNGRHLLNWSVLADRLRCDRRAVKRWHAQGITIIARALEGTLQAANAPAGIVKPPKARPASGGFCAASGAHAR